MLFNHNGEEQFTEACRTAKPWEIILTVFLLSSSVCLAHSIRWPFLTFAGWPRLRLINPLSYILNANQCDIWALFLLYEVGITLLTYLCFCSFPSPGQCFSFLSLEPEQKWEVVRLRPQFFDESFWRTVKCRKRDTGCKLCLRSRSKFVPGLIMSQVHGVG